MTIEVAEAGAANVGVQPSTTLERAVSGVSKPAEPAVRTVDGEDDSPLDQDRSTMAVACPAVAGPFPRRLYACRSVRGRRNANEDAVAAVEFKLFRDFAIWLGAVADGVGSLARGEEASALALGGLAGAVAGHLARVGQGEIAGPDGGEMLVDAVRAANRAVIHESVLSNSTMGSTLVAVLLHGTTLHVVSVGDSRVYRCHDGVHEVLTHDDSRAQKLIDAGVLTPDDPRLAAYRHEITRCLGFEADVDGLTAAAHPVSAGDIVLLCSDGLWCAESAFPEILATGREAVYGPEALGGMADRLVEGALACGSSDNVSLVLLWLAPEAPVVLQQTEGVHAPTSQP